MKHKRLIASILIGCLILLCAATILVSWLSFNRILANDVHFGFLNLGQFSAKADQAWTFKTNIPTRLVIDSTAGNIDITAGEGNEIKVTAHKTAWGITTKRAESALANMPIEVKQEGNQVIVSYKQTLQSINIGSEQYDTVDFIVTVPEECSVSARTKIGKITVAGVKGDADLHNDFGNLSTEDIKGNLNADTKSGDIHAQRISSGTKTINLATEFGSIELENTSVLSIEVRTKSGKVNLDEIATSGIVELQSEFGDIQIQDSKSETLTIQTNSGKITAKKIETNAMLVASSQFGDIEVQQVIAPGYDISSNSGNITVQNGTGAIKASTEFGRIVISSAKDADLDLRTNNGVIEFSGSLGEGPHTLRTEFGDIHLELPEDSRLTLDVKTEFGKLKSAFPITLSGEIEGNSWKGTINGGGSSLQAQTNNGNIALDLLSE
jgi:DUF4097 and DUF4098 domain-containing protein YvlB